MRINLKIPDEVNSQLVKITKETGMNRQDVILWLIRMGFIQYMKDKFELNEYIKANSEITEPIGDEPNQE